MYVCMYVYAKTLTETCVPGVMQPQVRISEDELKAMLLIIILSKLKLLVPSMVFTYT